MARTRVGTWRIAAPELGPSGSPPGGRGRVDRCAGETSAAMTRALPFAILVLVFACGSASGASSARGAALTPIKIATLAIEPAGPIFYAKARGFFAQQGIDAEIVVLSVPEQLGVSLISGQVQFSGANIGGIAIMKSRDAPVRVVAAGALYDPNAPNSALVVAPGKTIRRATDLVGKRIVVDSKDSIAGVGVREWLQRGGVAADRVGFVELAFPLMLGPLMRGQVDAAFLPEPYLTQAVQRGAKRIGRVTEAVCPTACLQTMFIARKDVEPNLAARFRNAIQAASAWANQKRNDRASAAIIARVTRLDSAVIAKMTRTRFAVRLRPALAQPWIDALAKFGVIPASFRAIDLVK